MSAGVPVNKNLDGRSRLVYLGIWGPQAPPSLRSPLRLRRVLCDSLPEAQALVVAGCAWLYAADQEVFGKVSRVMLKQGGLNDGLQMETGRWLLDPRRRWVWLEV